uniref:Vomeronasal type-1 receptor n=1 Tax=Felis catus TaxID=9685 RepID=A0ABI7ZT50_FELCA
GRHRIGTTQAPQVFLFLLSVSDAIFTGLMVCSSGSMVPLLHRHHQKIQYIHNCKGYHKCSPETRAAHAIVMLVAIFVVFYMLNSILAFDIITLVGSYLWLMYTSHTLASCSPTICLLLLILMDSTVPNFHS